MTFKVHIYLILFRLTESEKRERAHRKKMLEYATDYDKAGDVLKKNRYHLPDASTKIIPTDYVEEEDVHGGDGRRWEHEKLSSAVFKAGAKDRIVSSLKLVLLYISISRKQTSLMNFLLMILWILSRQSRCQERKRI